MDDKSIVKHAAGELTFSTELNDQENERNLIKHMYIKTSPLSESIQPFVDKDLISGAVVLAATKSEILSCEAVGWADVAAKKPMTVETLFWIASMTKPITATLFMMLVDEGLIQLDDPVEKYLPEFKGQMVVVEEDEDHRLLRKPHHPITVREILNHTSGLPFASPVEKPFLDGLRLETAVRSYAMTPLQFEPGSKYAYSNEGTNTAGRLIEVLSKMPYETVLDERLLKPLGLGETTFWPSKNQLLNYAKVYRAKPDNTGIEEMEHAHLTTPFYSPNRYPMPGGGLFSTAKDVVKFCQMILNGGVFNDKRYISESAIHEMTRKQTGEAIDMGYGLGWVSGEKYGHAGAYKTNMTIDSKAGLITILLTHHNGPWHDEELGKQLMPTFVAAAEKLLG